MLLVLVNNMQFLLKNSTAINSVAGATKANYIPQPLYNYNKRHLVIQIDILSITQ